MVSPPSLTACSRHTLWFVSTYFLALPFAHLMDRRAQPVVFNCYSCCLCPCHYLALPCWTKISSRKNHRKTWPLKYSVDFLCSKACAWSTELCCACVLVYGVSCPTLSPFWTQAMALFGTLLSAKLEPLLPPFLHSWRISFLFRLHPWWTEQTSGWGSILLACASTRSTS